MIYGSVCSGIEAASCAWSPLGWKAAFLSEIEPFPRAVLAHHYPETPLHGDFTTIKANDYAAIDLLVGGTPCQSFSVAGLRKGLDDPRGNLMLEFGALAQRLAPRWIVWENVPGVLSSNGGMDFGTFLGMLAELGYGFAYRVLDAQYFGVAQRRRRVFVVGYFGDWRRAAAVLFEQDCMRGNPAPSREAGKDVAPTIRVGASNGGAGHGARSGDSKDELIVPIGFPGRMSGTQCASAENISPSISSANPTAVAVSLRDREGGATAELGDEVGNCLRASSGGGDKAHVLAHVIGWSEELTDHHELAGTIQRGGAGGRHDGVMDSAMQVRRLTPVECERLQGFRDDYTLVDVRGKPAADGPRYKALGNSMAVPVIAWLGRRIEFVDSIPVAVKVAA